MANLSALSEFNLQQCLGTEPSNAWIFPAGSTADSEPQGRCVPFTDCALPGFSFYSELQHAALPGFSNNSSPWLVSTQHPCLRFTAVRTGISSTAGILFLIILILILELHAGAILHERALYDGGKKCLLAIYGVAIIIPAGFAAVMAFMEPVANLALLPMFALFVLGADGLHFLPENPLRALGRIRAGVEKFQRWCRCGCMSTQGFRQAAIYAAVLLQASAATLGCTVPVVGMLLQASTDLEVQEVQRVAWLDVAATLAHGILLFCGAAGVHRYRAFHHRPHWLALITFVFAAALFGIGCLMKTACTPEQYLLPTSSLHDFDTCSQLIADRAYALSFMSMLRQFVLLVVNAAFEAPAADAPIGDDVVLAGNAHDFVVLDVA